MRRKIMDELKKLFNPELLNRIDETVIFHALDRGHIMQIIDILSVDIAKRLAEKGISFKLTDEAKDFLVDKGFEPAYGARPLKRALQKYLEDPLAEEILRGQYAGDLDLTIGSGLDRLTFTFNTPAKEQKVGQ
jgi:ATP-dependent Clp protease ATP-binding subunit ClpC